MIKPLTSFRFFAALLVFFYHVGIWRYYETGYIGVTFFFILSGFILSYNYGRKFSEVDYFQIRSFYLARIAKIYPIHLLTFFLSIPIYFYLQLKHSIFLYILQAFANVLLLQSYIPIGNFSFNGPSWSISDELFFYAVFPFIVFFVLKHFRRIKNLFILTGILWILIAFISVIFSVYINQRISTWIFYIFPLTRLFDFFVGIVLNLLYIEVKEKCLKIPILAFTLLELFALLLNSLIVIFSPSVAQNLRYSLIFIPFLTFLIFIFAFQRGIISHLLSNKILVYLGEISFSFYMIHNLVLSYIYWSFFKLQINPITIIGCFIITIALSSALYKIYEEPLRKKIRNNFSKSETFGSKMISKMLQ